MRRAKAYTKGNVGQGQLKDMVMISERPADVKDRAVPGHWEGDLIFGKKTTSIGTLVERHSRYVMLLKLPNGHGAEAVRKAMTKRILTLPAQLRRSITWDKERRWQSTSASRSRTACRSTSVTPRVLGSAGATRTPIPAEVVRPLAMHPARARRHRPLA
jgi:IS30 family transposase